jgi:hypothetical protein
MSHWDIQRSPTAEDQFPEKRTGVGRGEVFRDNDGLFTGLSDNCYEATLGSIYKPVPWLWFRPQVRFDWAQFTRPFDNSDPADRFRTNHQLTFGFYMLFIF